jgi:hypothetical protein
MARQLRFLLVPLSVLAATTGWAAGDAVAAASRPVSAGPQLSSPDFAPDGPIPTRFTCRGAGDRPTLNWSGMPAADSFAVVVLDPDAAAHPFVHWVVYNLPAARSGTLGGGALPAGAHETQNTAGKIGWKPPCPPSGTHHYHFTLYADRGAVPAGSTADTIAAIRKQAIAQATLTGTVDSLHM